MADKHINKFNSFLSSIQSAKLTGTVFYAVWSAAVAWYDGLFTDDQFHQLVGASLEQIRFLKKRG